MKIYDLTIIIIVIYEQFYRKREVKLKNKWNFIRRFTVELLPKQYCRHCGKKCQNNPKNNA